MRLILAQHSALRCIASSIRLGSLIGVPPSTAAAPAPAVAWQPPATDRVVGTSGPWNDYAKGGWQSAPTVGTPTDEMPTQPANPYAQFAQPAKGNFFDDLVPQSRGGW